jgi:hypothetical protein
VCHGQTFIPSNWALDNPLCELFADLAGDDSIATYRGRQKYMRQTHVKGIKKRSSLLSV